jgi:hypothetical protein
MRGSLLERFEDKVEHIPFSECALWSGATDKHGYGRIGVGRRAARAHRVAYELYIGPIQDGLHVLHTCHNGHLGCASPDHLKLGTHQDNMRDMVSVGRLKGENHSHVKLTEQAVGEIRARCAAGERQAAVAKDYGVSQQNVSKIANRRKWGHLK